MLTPCHFRQESFARHLGPDSHRAASPGLRSPGLSERFKFRVAHLVEHEPENFAGGGMLRDKLRRNISLCTMVILIPSSPAHLFGSATRALNQFRNQGGPSNSTTLPRTVRNWTAPDAQPCQYPRHMEFLPLSRLQDAFSSAFLKTEPPDHLHLGIVYLERAYNFGHDAAIEEEALRQMARGAPKDEQP